LNEEAYQRCRWSRGRRFQGWSHQLGEVARRGTLRDGGACGDVGLVVGIVTDSGSSCAGRGCGVVAHRGGSTDGGACGDVGFGIVTDQDRRLGLMSCMGEGRRGRS
jgi:hypothetical protein